MELLAEQDWKKIAAALSAGRCILVLGPDIAIDPDNPSGGTLSGQLSASIAAGINAMPESVDKTELHFIAQRYLDHGGQRWKLEEQAAGFYQGLNGKTTELHRVLAALPFRFYLSVTHDPYLHNALVQEPQRQPTYHYYDFKRSIDADLREPDASCPLVYQLYGSVENPQSMVLSENDLLEFLENIVTSTPPLPPLIESLLKNEQSTFLFLGFGFSQWYVRLLLHTLLGSERVLHRTNLRPSLVFEGGEFYNHPDSRSTTAYFENQQAFLFREYHSGQFAQQLAEKCEQMRKSQVKHQAALPDDSPLVFLSYRSTDRDSVEQVRDRLEREQIRTWQDRQNLRGGDRWEQAIRKVIGEQADYFVVMQTPSLVEAEESVVFDEIREAQKRDKRRNLDDHSSFIIPVILKPCPGLQTLKADINMVDLTEEQGLARLINDIKADWRERRDARSS